MKLSREQTEVSEQELRRIPSLHSLRKRIAVAGKIKRMSDSEEKAVH
jgi:hypothetical protein